MHGEMRHLVEHARFAKQCGIEKTLVVLNGEMARLSTDDLRIIDEVPNGRLHKDGHFLLPGYDGPTNQRRKLGYAGIITVALVVDKSGEIIADPAIISHGLPKQDDHNNQFENLIEDAVDTGWDRMSKREKLNDDALAEGVRRQIRREVNDSWGKKPICYVTVTRLSD